MIVNGLFGVAKIQIDKGRNLLLLTEAVRSHIIVSGIEEQLGRHQFRSEGTEAEECFTEAVGIVLGCGMKQGEQGEVVIGIGDNIHDIAEIEHVS